MKSFTRVLSISILILLLLVTGSTLSFASDDIPDPNIDFVEDNLRKISVPLTLQLNTDVRASYTIDDVYNLLYNVFYNGSTSAYGSLTEINNNLTYYVSGTNYSMAQLMAMTWGLTDDIRDTLINQQTILSAISNASSLTNSKLEYVFSAIEDTINIKWYNPSNVTYLGFSSSRDGAILSSDYDSNRVFYKFNIGSAINENTPCLFRIFIPNVPLSATDGGLEQKIHINNIYINPNGTNNFYPISGNGDYFTEGTKNGTYIYIFNMRFGASGNYIFEISSEYTTRNYTLYPGTIFYIPFDTIDFQIMRSAFYSTRLANNLNGLDKLIDLYASDDLIAAKAAQQAYENEALQEFTGSGSGSASRSDKTKLKNTSSTIKTGLSSGGSVDNSLSVFDNSSSIWDWFTQPVADSLDSTSTNPLYQIIYFDSSVTIPNNGYNTFNVYPLYQYIYPEDTVYIDIISDQPFCYQNCYLQFRHGSSNFGRIGNFTSNVSEYHFTASPSSVASALHFTTGVTYGSTLYIKIWRYVDNYPVRSHSNQDYIVNFIEPNLKDIKHGQSSSERR